MMLGRYSVFASLFDLRAAVPADEARLRAEDCSMVFLWGNLDLWGEQASGSLWEIQVWCCTRWRWTKVSLIELSEKTREERQCDNLEQFRSCWKLQPMQPFKDSALFTLLGTLLATSFYPLHCMLMSMHLGAYTAVSYHSYHASDW